MSENRQAKNLDRLGHGNLYRVLSTIAYVGVFAAIGVIIITLTSSIRLNAYLWGIIATIAILSIGIISALPWIRRIEQNEYKVASIVFAAFIAVCVVLWTICLWIVVFMAAKGNIYSIDWFLQFLKIAILVSLQLAVSTFVGNVVIKCGKTMIFVQVIAYLSYLFVDFYLSYLVFCIVINPGAASPIYINTEAMGVLGKPAMTTIFALAFVYTIIAKFIMRSIENRRIRAITEEMVLKSQEQNQAQQTVKIEVVGAEPAPATPVTPAADNAEAKLAKLKDLYDKQLITQEDYNKKRDEILKQL